MDVSLEVIPNAMYALHALTPQDLEQWSIIELYEWADEQMKDLAQDHGLFTTRLPYGETNSIGYTPQQAFVALPADHLATVEAEANGLRLYPTTVVEMQAYADNWDELTAAAPARYVGDAFREGQLTLQPIPTAAGTLALVYERQGITLAVGATVELQLNVLWGDALTLKIVAQARAIETDAQAPEVVTFCEALLSMYAAAATQYYAGGF